MTADFRKEVARRYNGGQTIKQIAESPDVCYSETYIRKVLIGEGVVMRLKRIAPSVADAIAKEYAAGVHSPALAAKYGVSSKTVRLIGKMRGIRKSTASKSKVTPEMRDAILAVRYKESGSVTAKRHGLHVSTIHKIWSERARALGMGR